MPELVSKTKFRIVVTPGSSYEDDFKTAIDPDWKIAWNERVKPHLDAVLTMNIGLPLNLSKLTKLPSISSKEKS